MNNGWFVEKNQKKASAEEIESIYGGKQHYVYHYDYLWNLYGTSTYHGDKQFFKTAG